MTLRIEPHDLGGPDVAALLAEHLADMRAVSPAESVHALDLDGLRRPGVRFWAAYDDAELVGCVALAELGEWHLELKSMRVRSGRRGSGHGAALLDHALAEARDAGAARVSLETGSQPYFEPARRLYASRGFVECGPFGDYREDPASTFMTLDRV